MSTRFNSVSASSIRPFNRWVLGPTDSSLTAGKALSADLKIGVPSCTFGVQAMAEINKKNGRNYKLKEYPSYTLAA
ncbi:MAG: hypothetical protein AMR96_06280 [Candidatus Adiutrix intracellularis]|nr:MAG: hypothetical protein AMR96_06280 [Candidatus Adiutrix intracellularis]MDR2826890.1 hypothetical protein [Candidatus Adiutrix intracellularis]